VINYPNKATNFSGSNAYMRLNHTVLLEPAAVTVELWIKPSAIPVNDTLIVVSPQPGNNENSNASGYDLVFDGSNNGGNGKVAFNAGGGVTTSAVLPLGVWSYVVGTSDGTAVRIYVNGKQSNATGGAAPSYSGVPNFDALIARNTFPGDLADVAIYGSGLSATQIATHYAVAGYAPGPVTPSTNSASLTWTPPAYSGTSSISSYAVTPVLNGLTSNSISVSGQATGVNIANLVGAASYTFQVAAINSSGLGTAVTSGVATIGTPSSAPGTFGTYLLLKGGPGNGQAFSHYGFVGGSNIPAMSSWTIEERLWGIATMATTGSHMTLGALSGTTSNPTDQNPVAGLNFNIGGAPLQTYFIWPGGSCAIPSGSDGIGLAFSSSTITPAHVALTYDGTTVRGFINGTLVSGCSVSTGAAALSAGPFGFMDNAGLAQGNFDEVRVSNIARWTNNFTAPTQQYASDSNTMLLWHFNDYPISQVLSTHILSNTFDGVNFVRGEIPSQYLDASASANQANTFWASGASSVTGNDDWRRAYSLGPGVTPDELVGSGSQWLCVCAGYSGAPVNHATGELWHEFTDFNIPGRVALDFTRTYSTSRTSTLGPTGFGWTDRYNEYLSFDGSGNATAHENNGSAVVFTFTSPSSYAASPSEHVTLVKNGDSTFTLTDTAKNQTIFNPQSGTTSSLQKIVDRHGGAAYTLTMAYNADGTLASVTDPANRKLSFTYQTIGTAKLIQTINDTASPVRSVTFQYGTNSSVPTTYQSLTQFTDVAGGVTRFTYNGSHYLLTMTDPNGGVTTNTYDASNRVATQQDALMRPVTSYSYASGLTTITDPKGNVSQEEYLNGILMTRTKAPGTAQQAIFGFGYDPNALATTVASGPNGQTSTSTRDANANVLTTTDPEGRITSSIFNSFNEPLTRQDPSQVTTTFTYNATGDIATVSRPLVGTMQTATTTYIHGDSTHPGDVTTITDPDGNSTTYTYDTAGDQLSMIDPLLDKTTYGYDTIGRMTSMVTPKGNVKNGHPSQFTWSYTYDAFGNRLTATDPLSHKTTYHFDPNQNPDKVTDPDGNITTKVYDLDNELTQVKRADSPQTSVITDYNADGTISDEKDGKGNAIVTYGYDNRGRLITVADALGNTSNYTYDGASNVATIQNPGGNCASVPAVGCTTYVYDSANQPVAIHYSDGITPNVAMTYDSLGQRIGMTDGTGTSSWGSDSLQRLVSYTNGNGVQMQWAYNLRNLPTTITYPGSLNVIRGYDAAGRWTSVKDWNLNTTTFGYDVNSNLTTETFPTGNGVVATNTYDNSDRLTAISDKKGNTTKFAATYTLDSASLQVADSSATSGQGSYKYTPLLQLCYAGSSSTNACSSPPSGSQAFAYDAADNLTQIGTTQQAFNNADELCWTATTTAACTSPPSGATTYQYDSRGNRTAVTPNPGQAVTMTFDQTNRLTKYVAASTETYGYNGDGLRMCKVAGAFSQPCSQPGATQFVWDLAAPLPLLLKDGATSYIYGPGDAPVEQVNGSSTLYFLHDRLGSTRAVTDSSGAIQATYTFQPFGQLASSTNPGNITNPIQFAGQYLDPESGYYYLRARYYEPVTSQFISRDPLVATSRSPYGYVGNNPTNAVDPGGAIGLGVCGNLNFMVAIFNFGGTGCFEEIENSSTVETGVLGLGYGGLGIGVNVGGTIALQASNADHLNDLANGFLYFTVAGEAAAGASITVFVSLPFASRFTYGGEVGPAIGLGANVAGGISYTWVHRFNSWQSPAVNAYINANVTDPVQTLTVARRILDQRGITGSPRPMPC
jgi:RHS repeat-associated protein